MMSNWDLAAGVSCATCGRESYRLIGGQCMDCFHLRALKERFDQLAKGGHRLSLQELQELAEIQGQMTKLRKKRDREKA